MARFLFAAWPFAGDLFPNIAVGRALSARGHTVAFYTGAVATDLLHRQGFELFAFDPALEQRTIALVQYGMATRPNNPWRFETELRAFFLDSMRQQVSDLDAICARWTPDAIVCDPALWGAVVILPEIQRVPVALLSTYIFCFLPGSGVPTPGLSIRRGRTWAARLRGRAGALAADMLLARTRRGVNRVRQEHGLAPLDKPIVASMARLPLHLVPSCREFDYDRQDLPTTVHYIGPCLWYPSEETPAQLAGVPRDKPWVHVTEGTLHWQEPVLLRTATRGLAGLPVEVLLTSGDRDPVALGLGSLAPNLHLLRWAPHSTLVPRCAAVVTTGGAGTIMAALTAGVPLVVVPTNWDKPENALRVEAAGAGVHVPHRRCSPARLRAAVEKVITDPSYRANAERLRACLQGGGGPAAAVELLERMVAGAGPPMLARLARAVGRGGAPSA